MIECPNCKHELIEKIEGCCYSLKCTYCDYAVATTKFPEIELDETQYTVTLLAGNDINKDTITFVKGILCKTTSETINILKSNSSHDLFTGNAVDVLQMKTKLDKLGINYTISPLFLW